MILTARDIIYLLTYVITLISVLITIRFMLIEIRKDQRVIKNIIFGDRGALNIITVTALKAHLDEVWAKMRRNDQVNEMILQKVDDISKNQIIIMVHQGITSPNGIKEIVKKDN